MTMSRITEHLSHGCVREGEFWFTMVITIISVILLQLFTISLGLSLFFVTSMYSFTHHIVLCLFF